VELFIHVHKTVGNMTLIFFNCCFIITKKVPSTYQSAGFVVPEVHQREVRSVARLTVRRVHEVLGELGAKLEVLGAAAPLELAARVLLPDRVVTSAPLEGPGCACAGDTVHDAG